ncbi:glutathione peroxidase [Zavarzinella formosa]|uniref:glutathione peroxidase n=1 Tax=Zavarzinella formosa TaxID=360055 RepID=UPI0002E98658|nr:glutathione peroxidase [Zavarzinella formosa]
MSIYTIPVTTIDGRETTLEKYRGRVMLIVNVASRCMFTGHYAGLEDLYKRFKDQGLVVLGFPCRQFLWQEKKEDSAINNFCTLNYGVSFPMFAKVLVNGGNAHPLFQHLKAEKAGFLGSGAIKWNFTKFLVDRSGHVVGRYSPMAGLPPIEKALPALLAEQPTAAS